MVQKSLLLFKVKSHKKHTRNSFLPSMSAPSSRMLTLSTRQSRRTSGKSLPMLYSSASTHSLSAAKTSSIWPTQSFSSPNYRRLRLEIPRVKLLLLLWTKSMIYSKKLSMISCKLSMTSWISRRESSRTTFTSSAKRLRSLRDVLPLFWPKVSMTAIPLSASSNFWTHSRVSSTDQIFKMNLKRSTLFF